MAERTAISWATSTFNPWIGCTKVSPGCDNCYAELLDRNRFSKTMKPAVVHWGAGAPRHRTSDANWRQPYKWDAKAKESGKPWRVFCASLADIFDNEVPAAWRLELGHVIWQTPHLTWLLLTKRIGNVKAALRDFNWTHFPENAWLGITVVTQEEADRDIPKLMDVRASLRWLSIEPQLEAIDVRTYLTRRHLLGADPLGGVEWVVTGGESGIHGRPYDYTWARSLRDQCRIARAPIFVKQMGAHPMDSSRSCSPILADRAGSDPAEWPEDLRLQEFPA